MARTATPSFAQVYDRGFAYVWRTLRALGVDEAHIDDAVQDTFVVVARRLDGFEGRARLETWLFAIALNIVFNSPWEPLETDVAPHRWAEWFMRVWVLSLIHI